MVDEFINDLKRDKARGNLAPHQIILLIALYNLSDKGNISDFNINELNTEFQKVWNEHQSKFRTKNNKIGLPLKAFLNREFIQIELTGDISDFRKNQELEDKISNIKIDTELSKILKTKELNKKLVERIVF